MDKTYKQIKRTHGETFARAIREACPRAFERADLPRVLRYAGKELTTDLLQLIRSTVTVAEQPEQPILPPWQDLAAAAGYTVTRIESLEQQKRDFARYYRDGELPCSFGGAAWAWPHIFYFVRHDADTVQPSPSPQREDVYSTSVLRVKLADGDASMVSRYNHGCDNPDVVHGGGQRGLNRLVPGLGDAMFAQLGLSSRNHATTDGYRVTTTGEIVRVYYEQGGVWFGDAAAVDAGRLIEPAAHELLVEGCILDTRSGMMREIAQQTDVQGLAVPWNDNATAMKAAGWRISRQGLRVIATHAEHATVVLLEVAPCAP